MMSDNGGSARTPLVVFSVILILLSASVVIDPVFNSSFGWRVDFGDNHLTAGFIISFIGAVFLYFSLKIKK